MYLSGLLNINKPAGLTSHDVVAHIRRVLAGFAGPAGLAGLAGPAGLAGKVGHTGTLDPFATGVLLVAVGPATRLIKYSHAWDKEYQAVIVLGASSDTDDAAGKISKTQTYPKPKQISKFQITNTLPQFIGQIQQTPPAYSAKKIAGERAYQLARRGIKPVLPPRAITIYALRLTSYRYPELSLTITCSTGTYIRSLARDIGATLGTGAYVKQLRRTRIGPHKIATSLPINKINSYSIKQQLLPPRTLVSHLPTITLPDQNVAQYINGQPIGNRGADLPIKQTHSNYPLRPPAPTAGSTNNNVDVAVLSQSTTLLGTAAFNPATRLLYPNTVLYRPHLPNKE